MATLTRTLTFAQFYAAISNSLLNKGESITISDFASVYYLVGKHEGSFAHLLDEGQPVIKTGTAEPLTVYATSNSTIDIVAKSTFHPNDVIYYDWNPSNWLNNMNFSTDGENIIDGWKGVIHFRRDTLLNNQTNHDYRNVVNRLHSIAQAAWVEGVYSEGDFVQHTPTEGTLGIYIAKTAITNEEPGVDAVWQKVIGIDGINDNGAYLSFDDTVFYVGVQSIPILNANDYQDKSWLGENCNNCVIPEFNLVGDGVQDVLIPLIVFGNYCQGLVFKEYNSALVLAEGNFGMSFGSRNNLIVLGKNNNGISIENNNETICFGNGNNGVRFGNNCNGIIFGNNNHGISFGNSNCEINFSESVNKITIRDEISGLDAVALGLDLTGIQSKDFVQNIDGDILMLHYDETNTLVITDLSTL